MINVFEPALRSEEIEAVCMRCLEQTPKKRFDSALDLDEGVEVTGADTACRRGQGCEDDAERQEAVGGELHAKEGLARVAGLEGGRGL